MLLAAILAGTLWLLVAPPAALTGDRLGRHLAVGVTLAVTLWPLVSPFTDLAGDEESFGYVFLTPMAAIFATALAVARRRRSAWAGVQATVWTALLVSLAFYALGVTEAVHYFGGDSHPADVLGSALRGATVYLVVFPAFWIPIGCWAAAVGGQLRPRPA